MAIPILNADNTVVIADFDGTLIKKVVAGKKVPSLMSVLVDPKYIGTDGVQEAMALVEHYYPIELNHDLSVDEKNQLMQEWWEKSYEVMIRHKVTQSMIKDVCSSPLIQLRDFLPEFMTFLSERSIPLIIYSASGIGFDSIKYLLRKHNLLSPTVRVCSNDLIFDRNGFFASVKPPIIHAANKTGLTLVENKLLPNKPPRRECLLIGDSLDDVRMVEGLDFDRVVKVAFANSDMPKFDALFDIVLPIDSGYAPIRKLLS